MKHPRTESNWRGQCSFNRPSTVDASVYALIRYASQLRPLHRGERLSIMLKDWNIPAIPPLLFRGGPSAIVRAVPAVWVDSVNGVPSCRRGPHVGKERIETVAPPFAHRDPPAAVEMVVETSRVVTPFKHQSPSVVLLRGLAAIRVTALTVLQISGARKFSLQAPARVCVPRPEFVRPNGALIPTRAEADPSNSRPSRREVRDVFTPANSKQATECLTGKVNKSWHFFTLKWLTVMGAWQAAVNSFSGATLAKHLHFSRGFV